MKRIFLLLFAVLMLLLLISAFASPAFAADVLIDASFEDGFSDNSGRLAVTVTNRSENAADVTLTLALPEGVSAPVSSATLAEVAPGESAVKDFMLTFEPRSFLATHKMLFVAAAVFIVTLVVFIVVMLRRPKSPPKAALLALAIIPAMLLCARAFAADEASRTITVTHEGKAYEVTIAAAATEREDQSAEVDMSFPAS